MRRKTAVLSLLFLLILVGSLGWGIYAILSGSSKLEPIFALASFAVSVVALFVSVRELAPSTEPATSDYVEAYAAKLIAEVKRVTAGGAMVRDLREDGPNPVGWRIHGDPPADDALVNALPSEGDIGPLIDGFVRCGRRRRMVVIGDPGSGKSSLSLLLTLALSEPVTSRPVPVLLPMASWEPDMSLRRWISHRMVEEYPFLGAAGEQESGVAAMVSALFDRQLILPIFDGLDEMAENRHRRTGPLRWVEFRAATPIRAGAARLARAAKSLSSRRLAGSKASPFKACSPRTQ